MGGGWRGLLRERGDVGAYFALLAACVFGLLGVHWWAGIILPGLLLTLISWRRWGVLVAKAAELDGVYIALGWLTLKLGRGGGVCYFLRSRLLLTVLIVTFGHDWLFAALAYLAGIACGWAWGIAPIGGWGIL